MEIFSMLRYLYKYYNLCDITSKHICETLKKLDILLIIGIFINNIYIEREIYET